METCVKIGFAQISLAAQKIWVAQNLGWRGGGEGVLRPPPPPPTPMGAINCFFDQTHVVSVKFDISETVCNLYNN